MATQQTVSDESFATGGTIKRRAAPTATNTQPQPTQNTPAPATPVNIPNNPEAQAIASHNTAQTPSTPAPATPQAVKEHPTTSTPVPPAPTPTPASQSHAEKQPTPDKIAFWLDAMELQKTNPQYIAQRNKNISTNLQSQVADYMNKNWTITDAALQGMVIDYIQKDKNYTVDPNSSDRQHTINNIVSSLKQSPGYSLNQARDSAYQQYSSMSVSSLAQQMQSGDLVPGTTVWNRLMTSRPEDMAAAQAQKSLGVKQDIMSYLLGNVDTNKSLSDQITPMTLFGTTLGMLTQGGTPSNLADQYQSSLDSDPQITDLRTQNKNLLDQLNTKKRDIENLREDLQAQITAWGGVATSAYISALAAEKSKPLVREYEALVDQYNANQGTLKDLLDEKKTLIQLSAQDQQYNMQLESQQLSKLWFLANLYDTFTKDQRDIEKQKQLMQMQYDFNNPDMNSSDPTVQTRALNDALKPYYDQYSSIIKRPQAQVVNDVKSYAKQQGISIAQALQENFISQLQAKPEYKSMLQKAMWINNQPIQVGNETRQQNPDWSWKILQQQNVANMSWSELFATLRSGNYNGQKFFWVYSTGDANGQRGASLYEQAITQWLDSFVGNYQNSPITASMIQSAAQQYGVDPEMIAATMALDSSMGTKGKAVRTMNPGNVGNTDSWAERTYSSRQEWVNAVAQNLNKRISALQKVAGNWAANWAFTADETTNFQVRLDKGLPAKATPTERQRFSQWKTETAPLTSDQRSDINKITSSFDNEPVVKWFQMAQQWYTYSQGIDSHTSSPSDDVGLIYSLAKSFDPNSVVREWEYATAQKYISNRADQYGFDVKRAFSNTPFLSPESRDMIKSSIQSVYGSRKSQYDNIYNEYGRRINAMTGLKDGAKYITQYSLAPNTASSSSIASLYDTLWSQYSAGNVSSMYDTSPMYSTLDLSMFIQP